jgi:hypothetical protein
MKPAFGRLVGTAEPSLGPLPPELAAAGERARAACSQQRLRSHVERLARPRNRMCEVPGIRLAEQYIAAEFQAAGWHTESREFSFTDVTGLRDRAEGLAGRDAYTTYRHVSGVNVVARKPGPGRPVLIGAHYDTVTGSPGADDNASGVAALLELARVLGPMEPGNEIILAALDAEEIGSFGARALVAELAQRSPPSVAVIFESIGFTDRSPGVQTLPPGIGLLYPEQVARLRRSQFAGDWTLVIFRRSSAPVASAFSQALAHLVGPGLVMTARDPADLPVLGRPLARVAPFVRDFARSDHMEFWRAGVPAIQVTDTANFRNPHYHQPSDMPATLDYERVASIVAATAVMVALPPAPSEDRNGQAL